MGQTQKLWSCVGSAGVADSADLPKIVFSGATAQLGPALSVVVGGTPSALAETPRLPIQLVSAVLRYGVVAVDGAPPAKTMRIRHRTGAGRVVANLQKVEIQTGTETTISQYDSATGSANNNVQVVDAGLDEALDFDNNAYYIAVTLSIEERIGLVPEFPPLVSVLQLRDEALPIM